MRSFRQFLGHDCADDNQTSMQAFGDEQKKAKLITTEEGYQEWIDRYNGKIQVYVSINPIKKGSPKFPHDTDVAYWCNEYIDLDCEKPKKCKGYNATDEELERLEPFVGKINKWLADNGFKTGYNDFTGNGYRWILPIPPLKLDGVDLDDLAAKKKEFKKRLVKGVGITPGCGAAIDSVFDFKRITGVPGTKNMKTVVDGRPGRPRKPFTDAVRDEDQDLRDYIMLIKIEHAAPATSAPRPATHTLEEILKKNEKIRKLYNGDSSKYQSRSDAEWALCCELARQGFNPGSIEDALRGSALGKSDEKEKAGHGDYIIKTAQKAYDDVQRKHAVDNKPLEAIQAAQGQYEVVNFEMFRKLSSEFPESEYVAVEDAGVAAVYAITGDDFIRIASAAGAIVPYTGDDGRAIILTSPELLQDFIQGVEVHKDGDDTVYFLTIRGEKLEFGIGELTDVPTWRNKIIRCNLVISFDIKAHALRDAWSRMIADVLDRAKVEWEEEMSGTDLYSAVIIEQVQRLIEVDNREAFKRNPSAKMKENGAMLVKTDTLRGIIEQKRIPYDLTKIRFMLASHLLRSTKQIRIKKDLISVWFFKLDEEAKT